MDGGSSWGCVWIEIENIRYDLIIQRSSMAFQLKFVLLIDLYNNNLNLSMAVPYRSQEPKRKYAKISLKKRENLVEMVINQGHSLTKTSKKLSLKLSTAKLILRKYKQTGKFHIRKLRRNMSPEEAATPIQHQQHPPVKFEQCSQKNTQEVLGFSVFPPNAYPLMYGEPIYPYMGCFGMWAFQNLYQVS